MNTVTFAKRALSVATLALASIGANATVYDFGTISAPDFLFQSVTLNQSPGAFQDKFTFSLTGWVDASGTIFTATTNTDRALVFTDVQLFSTLSPVPIDSLGGGTIVAGQGILSPGSYYFVVDGTTSGLLGGRYGVSITADVATPVPEPESYAMLLAGLGVMGAIALRRNRKNTE